VFEIRQADKSDIPDLVGLDDECFDVYYYKKTKFSKSDFEAYFQRSKCILLVAMSKSRLVGYVAGTVGSSKGLLLAHLDSIAVSLAERNKGIGSHLLDLFIREAKQQACQIVLLEVAEANKEGFDFFSRHGFQKNSDLPKYYGRDLNGVLMELLV
jgi:ribosomal protein S18 acetylase RimI-like enzyme